MEKQGQLDMRPGYHQRSDAIEKRLQQLEEENKWLSQVLEILDLNTHF